MSTVSISYGSLKDASNEADKVAKKISKYADSLYDDVYNKLSKYDGNWTSNLSTAKNKVSYKIHLLNNAERDYETYASDLSDLRDECKDVDKSVKSRISSLTASFKEAHGIRNSKVENAISYFFTGVGNETAFGRWLGSKKDDFDSKKQYLKDSIKEWYNYEGGKELIKGFLNMVLDVAIAVTAAIAAVATFLAGALTGGAILVLAAALIGSAIALQDAWADWQNEKAAYRARQNDDPATGKRRSDINSYSDYLRSSFMFGSDGETYHYNEYYNQLATGLEITSIACTVIQVGSGLSKLLKNGFKWATGNSTATFKEIFSKKGLTDMFNGVKSNIKSGSSSIWQALKTKNWSFFSKSLKNFGSDFLTNLKGKYLNFDGENDLKLLANISNSMKNSFKIPQSIIKNGLSIGTIVNIATPSIGIAHIPRSDKMITVGDFKSIGTSIGDVFGDAADLFTHDNIIRSDIMQKLSVPSSVNVSIPPINIPEVSITINVA